MRKAHKGLFLKQNMFRHLFRPGSGPAIGARLATGQAMCVESKQILNVLAGLGAPALVAAPMAALMAALMAAPAFATEPITAERAVTGAGGLALGAAEGGVTDRAFVTAPPNYHYIVERAPGSFVDCGAGMDARVTDPAGRSVAPLTCGVTLTETIVIPAASSSARLIVHY